MVHFAKNIFSISCILFSSKILLCQTPIVTTQSVAKVVPDTIFLGMNWDPIVTYYTSFDRLVQYDVHNDSTSFLQIIENPEDNFLSDAIEPFKGSIPNFSVLPNILFSLWNDDLLVKTATVFELDHYPIRSNVAVIRDLGNGNKRNVCSGTLVGKNIVLLDAHCLVNVDTSGNAQWNGLAHVYIAPMYQNATIDPVFDTIGIKTAFVPEIYYAPDYPQTYLHLLTDFGFVVLEENIGNQLGWAGVNTLETDMEKRNILKNRMYNFSYPGQKQYNGSDMYFSSSFLQTVDTDYYFSDKIEHIVGQSGSSYFYLNNQNMPLVFGLTHTINEQFYIPKNLIKGINKVSQTDQTATGMTSTDNSEIKLFPNPTSNHFFVTGNTQNIGKIELLDVYGQVLKTYKSSFASNLSLDNLPNGQYIVHIFMAGETIQRLMVKQE